jgi:hypothetical protein
MSTFPSVWSFKCALTRTLKNIKKKIGGHPTALMSGCGVHIIQPINCPIPLEEYNNKELTALEPDTSNKFLQFAERYLSAGKKDSSHNPALKSCLLRIPYSVNGKNGAEVEIIQKWDGYRPDYKLLIGSFHAYLVGVKADRQQQKQQRKSRDFNGSSSISTISWIEKLLKTPLEDYRQNDAVNLIIAPYLINIRHLDHNDAFNIIMDWLDKCEQLRPLSSPRREVNKRVEQALYNSQRTGIKPMRLDTLRNRNRWLYETLKYRI